MSALSALASYDISDEEDVEKDEGEKSIEKEPEPVKVEPAPVETKVGPPPKEKIYDVDDEDVWQDPDEQGPQDEEEENEEDQEEKDEESKPGDDSIKDVEDLSVIHDGSEEEEGGESSEGADDEAGDDLGEAMKVKAKRRSKRKSSENATNLAKKLRTSSVDEISIPPEPEGRCSSSLQDKIVRFMERKVKEGEDLNRLIQARKDFRNPSIYDKLIVYLNIEELGTNFPPDDYNPKTWRKAPAYDELARAQREDMAKREKERKTKVEFVTGTVKKPQTVTSQSSSSSDSVKKSKWDQQNSSTDKTKTTVISAIGSIKKPKV